VASPDDSLPGSPSIICEWIDSPEAGYAEQARLFFRSIGVTGTPVRTDLRPEGCSGSWALSSTIGGLPVSGLDTVVTLATRSGQAATNNEPSITDASGSFATWTPEGDYPLVDAQQGWDRVAMRPMPAMAELCQVPPDGTGCLATKETMTGGEIGLMRDRDLTSDRVVLVPAWLFTVTSTPYDPDGGPGPVNASSTSVIAVGAIADSALVPPPTEPGVVGTATSDPGPGVSGGSSPGSPGVGTAVPPDPADPPVPVGVPERMAGMEPAKPTPLTAN
jgi:hypothetical protein